MPEPTKKAMNEPEDAQPKIQGDGDVAGDRSTSQVVKAFRSAVKNVVQVAGDLVVSVSTWGLIATAVILVVGLILAAAVFNIPTLRELIPTPIPITPAREGESLIIVADFDDRSGGRYQGVDPAQYIYEKLASKAKMDRLDVRPERLREAVDDNTVGSVRGVYNARLLLWGWYDALTVTPKLECIKTLSEYMVIGDGLHLSLAGPEGLEFKIVTDLPNQATALMLLTLGVDQLTRGNYKEAFTYVDSVLEEESCLAPTVLSEGHFIRGIANYLKGDLEAALADFDKAAELDPENIKAHINCGSLLIMLGETERGLQNLDELLDMIITSHMGLDYIAPVYANRGVAYLQLGDIDSALIAFDKAISANPELWGAYVNRGIAYDKLGSYQSALADFDRASELNPDSAVAYAKAGSIYITRGSYEAALADFEQVLTIQRSNGDKEGELATLRDIGMAYDKLERHSEALASYRRALSLVQEIGDRAGEGTTLTNVGMSYQAQGRYEEALAAYQQALAIKQEMGDRVGEGTILTNIGMSYQAQGTYEEALAAYRQALAITRETGDPAGEKIILNNVGVVYFETERYQAALADFTRALELRPDDVSTYLNRGRTYYALGQYETALTDFTHALELDPQYANAYYDRGLVYKRMEELEKASMDFERVLELSSDPGLRAQAEQQLPADGWIVHTLSDPSRFLFAVPIIIMLSLALAGINFVVRKQSAVVRYTKIIRENPDLAEAYFSRGVVYRRLGQIKKAIADLERVLELSSDPSLRAKAEQHLRELRGDQP